VCGPEEGHCEKNEGDGKILITMIQLHRMHLRKEEKSNPKQPS